MKIVSTLCTSVPSRWKEEVTNAVLHSHPVVQKDNTVYLNLDGDVKNRRRLIQLRLSKAEALRLLQELMAEVAI